MTDCCHEREATEPTGRCQIGFPRAVSDPRGDAFSELIVQIFQLDGLLTAAGDALAKPAGQTSARWRVLAAVEEGPLTVSQIARAWGLARQSVQRVADALVRQSWAVYEEKPRHRRAQLLRLTPRGRRALRRIHSPSACGPTGWARRSGKRSFGIVPLTS